MKDGRIADGFVDGCGTRPTTRPSESDRIAGEEEDRRSNLIGIGIGGGIVAVVGTGLGLYAVAQRRKKAEQAREDHAYVVKHYGDAGTRLSRSTSGPTTSPAPWPTMSCAASGRRSATFPGGPRRDAANRHPE